MHVWLPVVRQLLNHVDPSRCSSGRLCASSITRFGTWPVLMRLTWALTPALPTSPPPHVLPCWAQVKEVAPTAAAWAGEYEQQQQQRQQGPALWGDEFASL